ncbi:MAG TPA: hypothetical protein VG961_04975 [Ignavibacteria bacterium]|nr:hypothetical protein [Ignavibacteria bacterium]
MKKIALIAVILALVTGISFSQFKEIPNKTKTKLKSGNGLLLGFINPKNFSVTHSFSMNVMTGGNTSVSLASYTATMNYKILKNLNLSADVTMQYSPYASIGSNNPAINKDFQNSLNGINLSRVSLDYSPTKDMHISVNYFNPKGGYYGYDNYYNSYYNPYWLGR